jgi:hypothetical protein
MATYSASPVMDLNGSRIMGSAAVREFHRGFGFARETVGETREKPAPTECQSACDCTPGLGCFHGTCASGTAAVFC